MLCLFENTAAGFPLDVHALPTRGLTGDDAFASEVKTHLVQL